AGRNATRGLVDGMWRPVLPPGEVITAELVNRRVTQRIVGLVDVRSGQVELAEEAAFVASLLEYLGYRRLVRRDLRVGEVDRENRVVHVGAQRIAPLEHQRAGGRALRHRPEIAEGHAALCDRVDVRRSRRRDAAVTEQF